MADRCFFQLVCAAEDAARFTGGSLELAEIDSLGAGAALSACGLPEGTPGMAEFEEAEFCGFDYLPGDTAYLARHGAGHEYPPGEIVCDGSRTSVLNSTTNGCYEVEVNENGQIQPASLERLREHMEIRRAAILTLTSEEAEVPTL